MAYICCYKTFIMNNTIKELECENFEVIKLAITSPTERYILKPKNKTNKELQNLFPKEDFEGKFPFSEYKGRFLVERTMKDVINGITLEEIIRKRKKELLNVL